mmetsp:Transcript_6471/g.11296  ORF Transcript_6471/g.11296 Transcript_6471/m.11296 type:complete len:445 (+) Transcript_6471:615-1949(+)
MALYERPTPSRNTSSYTHDSSLIERVNKIYQHTKRSPGHSDLKSRLMLPSGFLQKRLDALNSGRTNSTQRKRHKLFEKVAEKPKQAPSKQTQAKNCLGALKLKAYLIKRLRSAYSSLWFYNPVVSEEPVENSVALTRCPRCSFAGLTLLTSSTKENLSPRFANKIKALLPSQMSMTKTQPYKQNGCMIGSCAMTETANSPEHFLATEEGSPGPKDDISLCVYADDQLEENPPYKLTELPDLSIIPVEPCSMLSFESPPFSRANQSEFKFNESRYGREESSYFDYVQPKPAKVPVIPRLNIGNFSRNKPTPQAVSKEKLSKCKTALEKVSNIRHAKMQRAFDMMYLTQARPRRETLQSLTFEFSREELSQYKPQPLSTYGYNIRPLEDDEPIVLMCSTDKPVLRSKVPTNVRNSAFKLLSARISRLLGLRYKHFFRVLSQPRYRY